MTLGLFIAVGILTAGVAVTSCSRAEAGDARTLDMEVNPFIGTDFTGNTYPGAQVPFGMVQLSPDNGLPGWDRIAGYFYPDSTIAGFSHTHLSGTGAGDLYDISFMPVTLPYREAEAPLGIHSRFSHDSEQASAGYYKVTLSDYNIDVELTATERAGIQRYTFPGGNAEVILNLAKATNWDVTVATDIEIVDSVTVKGYRYSDGWARDQQLYFYTRFSRPFESVTVDTTYITDDKGVRTGAVGLVAKFGYNTTEGEQLTVSTAISGVSTDGAKANLMAEVPVDDFDKYRAAAAKAWQDNLGRIEVEGGTDDDRTIFYTALYHAMLCPTIYSDVDGGYRGPDKQTHKADGWTNYSTFSLWDTFRASHPLFTMIEPERVNDMVKSFLAFYDQHGRLPVWNMQGSETDMMLGYHAVPVIVDAYLKGIGDFDPERALAACVATANDDSYRGIGLYKQKGYVPYDVTDPWHEAEDWSLSRTLEYAFDDYCIAVMAKKMGKNDIAEEFHKRSLNYRNAFDPATRWMVPRDKQGRFQPGFNPDEYTAHISESNGWHYFWSVQHDVPGLLELMGGAKPMAQRLDSLMTYMPSANDSLPIFSTGMIGQYAHGNEPSHHVIYLYNAVWQPWKTAQYVRQVMRELYRNEPAGLCGNDDCGQTSAWYVLSALGFYPVNPVSGRYEIGSPLFEESRMKLPNGKTFTVKAPGASGTNIYVKSVKVNGEPWTKSYITHRQIMSGATVEFEMTSETGNVWY